MQPRPFIKEGIFPPLWKELATLREPCHASYHRETWRKEAHKHHWDGSNTAACCSTERSDQRVIRIQTSIKNSYYSMRRSSWVKQHWKSRTVLIASEIGEEVGEDSCPWRTGVPGARATTVREE